MKSERFWSGGNTLPEMSRMWRPSLYDRVKRHEGNVRKRLALERQWGSSQEEVMFHWRRTRAEQKS